MLGPGQYEDYTARPFGDIFLESMEYVSTSADDTQAYFEFSHGKEQPAQSKIESCLNEVGHCMAVNLLKLFDSKTEVIMF